MIRKLRTLDMIKFKDDIRELKNTSEQINDDLDSLVKCYCEGFKNILDKHAPEKLCQVTERDPTPWTSDEIKPWKKELRKLEEKKN